jgi:hypothetical protein
MITETGPCLLLSNLSCVIEKLVKKLGVKRCRLLLVYLYRSTNLMVNNRAAETAAEALAAKDPDRLLTYVSAHFIKQSKC